MKQKITKEPKESYTYKLKCLKCKKQVTGTTEQHVLSNFNLHCLMKHNGSDLDVKAM